MVDAVSIGQTYTVSKEGTIISLTTRKRSKRTYAYQEIFCVDPFNFKEVALELSKTDGKCCIELYNAQEEHEKVVVAYAEKQKLEAEARPENIVDTTEEEVATKKTKKQKLEAEAQPENTTENKL